MTAKKAAERVAVRATNHQTGEQWSIHDSRKVCEAELEKKLAAWGDGDHTVEWADLEPDHDPDEGPVAEPPVVAEGDGFSDTVE